MFCAVDCDLEVLTQEGTQKLQAALKVWNVLWIEDKPRENQGHVLVQTWETLPRVNVIGWKYSELEGVPESCCPRRSRPGVDGIDKESEAQTTEVTVSFGKRVVGAIVALKVHTVMVFHLPDSHGA